MPAFYYSEVYQTTPPALRDAMPVTLHHSYCEKCWQAISYYDQFRRTWCCKCLRRQQEGGDQEEEEEEEEEDSD